jgi:hypothetical protein
VDASSAESWWLRGDALQEVSSRADLRVAAHFWMRDEQQIVRGHVFRDCHEVLMVTRYKSRKHGNAASGARRSEKRMCTVAFYGNWCRRQD